MPKPATRRRYSDCSDTLPGENASSDPGTYTEIMRRALAGLGVQVTGLHEVNDAARAVRDAEAIFAGGGNSFRLLRALSRRRRRHPVPRRQRRFQSGLPVDPHH